jgi:hypothetical protein
MTIDISEEQRQLIILALARLSMERPGWYFMCEQTALRFDNKNSHGHAEMFDTFRETWIGQAREALSR